MTPATFLHRLGRWERLNFLLTNRIPRRYLTLFMGRFSRIRHPWVRKPSMWLWQFFAGDLRLHEARKTEFESMHDCFIRELKPGAREVDRDPALMVSPCDAIVGAHGEIRNDTVFQAKGFPYELSELLGDRPMAESLEGGRYITLRLTASMYHRFHAPERCRVGEVRYLSGDTWNVNPVALKRVERLFCRNERVVLDIALDRDGSGQPPRLVLVPVAAILVASIRLHGLSRPLDLRYQGANRFRLDRDYQRGEEMGYFEQGSTIIVLASRGVRLHPDLVQDRIIRMGQPLMQYSGAS